MRIELVCASPKKKNSVSKILLDGIASSILKSNESQNCDIHYWNKQLLEEKELDVFRKADTVAIAFPLYIDCLPSHLIAILIQLENFLQKNECSPKRIFAIINCGFLEGEQNFVAIEIIKNWAIRTKNFFSGGLAIGGGGMIKDVYSGKPFEPIAIKLNELAIRIYNRNCDTGEILVAKPYCPRFLYKLIGEKTLNSIAKKNGLSKKQIYRKQANLL